MEYEGYNLKSDGAGMLSISKIGSGGLPKALAGLWTSYSSAKRAIDTYKEIPKLPKRGKKDAAETDRGV